MTLLTALTNLAHSWPTKPLSFRSSGSIDSQNDGFVDDEAGGDTGVATLPLMIMWW